ncbi:FKBP-type peptidyl-prolyl cis-trans isomerase [Neisseriaceae bacterium ESL0693]|nr:FKBP-type peptidyl-prolyl cis-trans isomerase [Neisseriaceae bacterium ESL0693]
MSLTVILALSACHSGNNFKSNHDTASATAINQPSSTQDDFLTKNKTAPGVHTTDSGLQYKINREGNGKQPARTDVVQVEYEGRLTNGNVFDSTAMHGGQPVSFPLDRVIPGWTEGLQLMKEGSDYTFYIPADLAYGENSPSSAIPPNSTLIFDVKLIKVGQ